MLQPRPACPSRILATLLLLSSLLQPDLTQAEEPPETAGGGESQLLEEAPVPVPVQNRALLQAGYRFITPDGPGTAAAPYQRLKSGVIGGLSAGTLGSDFKLNIDAAFLHPDDYQTELALDYSGLVRVQAASQALWHNLLRERINPGSLTLQELDPERVYGTRTAITHVDSRLRLGNNPVHLNLGYWELKREGYEQLRFSDHYFTGPGTVVADTRSVNSVTREGKLGADAHLGPLDLSYAFRIRDFTNQAPDPRYAYVNTADNLLTAGLQAHDTVPDSRVTSHTVKAYSDLSGGLVGSAVYTLTQRENRGGHGDAVPFQRPLDTINTAAGDLSYTPSKFYSFALRYRHREIDRDSPQLLFYPHATSQVLQVRPPVSSVNDTVTLSATFRPAPRVIYRLEYNAELESRDNLADPLTIATPNPALHRDSRQTHTGKVSFYWRPTNDAKLNASYSYAACDNPAYGASFSSRHTGKLLLTYARSGSWGVAAHYLILHDRAESNASVTPLDGFLVTPPTLAGNLNLPRERRNNSASASLWLSPLERLTLTFGYAFLQSDIDQQILFNPLSSDARVSTNYRSTAQQYGIDALYAVSERLDLSLSFQQVFSRSDFNLPPSSFTLTQTSPPFAVTEYSTAGITEQTRLNTTETALSGRADWRFTSVLGCGMDYSFRRYRSGNPAYDGSVHTTLVSLKARW